MSQQRIAQSVNKLSYNLFERPVHPELFEIYYKQQFLQGDYEANIWLTGCNHVVQVFNGKNCLTELLCSPEQLLPQRGLIDTFSFKGEQKFEQEWGKHFGYTMNSQVEMMSQNVYEQTHKDLVKMAKKRGIYLPFPQWSKGIYAPFSYVDFEAGWETLHIQTFHAFPEQLTIVKTQSMFTMPSQN